MRNVDVKSIIPLMAVLCFVTFLLTKSCRQDRVLEQLNETREELRIDTLEVHDTVILPPKVLTNVVKSPFIPLEFKDSLLHTLDHIKDLKKELAIYKSKVRVLESKLKDVHTISTIDTVYVTNSPTSVEINSKRNLFTETKEFKYVDPVTQEVIIETVVNPKWGVSGQLGYGIMYFDRKFNFGPYLGIGLHYEF